MLPRWDTAVNCINLALHQLERIAKRILKPKQGRGRKPKRTPLKYVKLIAIKEFDERTLRGAESHLSRLVCNERIDHSVIAYWENKPEMRLVLTQFIAVAGALLDKSLSSLFTFVDGTKFSNWNIKEIEVTLCNRIAKETVYPIGISFRRNTVDSAVNEAVPEDSGLLYADAWYDVNEVAKVLFNKGYVPILCPNKNRASGFYRHKARELYALREHRLGYRQRGRGESVFGSLTNQFGDRFNARRTTAMQTRIAARILSYQIKLLIRINESKIVLIIRHARAFRNLLNIPNLHKLCL